MQKHNHGTHPEIRDYGGRPMIFNIRHATTKNYKFRITLWTGSFLQLTLMSIPVGSDIGVEMHPEVDQFIRIESGRASIYMGNCQGELKKRSSADENDAILIPAGTWHNIVNVGRSPLKLYSLYAPPQHPFGTVQSTKDETDHRLHT